MDFYTFAGGKKALQVQKLGASVQRVVIYAGSYEAELNGSNQFMASRTLLANGVMINTEGPNTGLSFMHQDRLGSTLVMTDKSGGILTTGGQHEFRSFDVFGKARDNRGMDNNGGLLNFGLGTGARTRNGFTGHEHLDEVGLIHMNGRAYDYNLGRFYGVDPIIQFPTNSQSLNGYSYLMNNPLSGTDPTGYCRAETGTNIKDCIHVKDGSTGKKLGSYNLLSGNDSSRSFRTDLSGRSTSSGGGKVLSNGGNLSADVGQGRTNSTRGGELSQAGNIGMAANKGQGENIGVGSPLGYDGFGCNYLTPAICRFGRDGSGGNLATFGTGWLKSGWNQRDMAAAVTPGMGWLADLPDAELSDQELGGAAAREAVEWVVSLDMVAKGLTKFMRGAGHAPPARVPGGQLGCCCFAAGTLIYTANGAIPVEDVAIGDYVWSRNELTGETALKPVTQLIYTPAKPIYALTLVAPDGSREAVEVTDNHPYYVIGQGWVDSGKLKAGMRIANFARGALVVESLVATGVNEVTYNFTVGDFHTYFVGEQKALVHNTGLKCACDPVVLFKAPSPSNTRAANEVNAGYSPDNYPGEGPFFTTDPEIAAKYQFHYQNGMQTIIIDGSKYNDMVKRGIIQNDFFEKNSIHVPANGLDEFNSAINGGLYVSQR